MLCLFCPCDQARQRSNLEGMAGSTRPGKYFLVARFCWILLGVLDVKDLLDDGQMLAVSCLANA
jgi:hypothetical protein